MRTDGQERGIPQHAPSQCHWSETVMEEKGSSAAGGLGCRCPLIMGLRSEFKEKENIPRTVDSYSSKKKVVYFTVYMSAKERGKTGRGERDTWMDLRHTRPPTN